MFLDTSHVSTCNVINIQNNVKYTKQCYKYTKNNIKHQFTLHQRTPPLLFECNGFSPAPHFSSFLTLPPMHAAPPSGQGFIRTDVNFAVFLTLS